MIATAQALALALALSVAGNVALGRAWLNARDDLATATEALRELADKRATAAAPARAAAATAARTLTKRADATLSSAPAVPGDMCASMQALGDEWLQARAKP